MKRILFIIKYIDYNNNICYLKDSITNPTKENIKESIKEYIDFCRKTALAYKAIKEIIGVKYKIINGFYNIDAFLYDNMYEVRIRLS